jgi:hypothetical protein
MATDTSLGKTVAANTSATKAATSNLSAADAALASLTNVASAAAGLVASNASVNTGTTSNTAITALTPKQPSGGTGSGSGTGTGTQKTVVNVVQNPNGTATQYWSDGTTTTIGSTTSAAATTGTDNVASAMSQLTQWGLLQPGDPNSATLEQKIKDLGTSGAGPNTILAAIQQSPEYAARFSGNAARTAAGFNALDPATYVQTENSYRDVLAASGVPAQYMTQSFLANLIGKNVSPTTLQGYVNNAAQLVTAQDPFLMQQAYNQYGLTQGDVIAHFLDPNNALPIVQQQMASTQIQAEAARQGLSANQANAATLAAQGVTQAQAQTGFANIGSQLANQQQLASTYGFNAGGISNELTAAQFNANVNGVTAAQAQQDITRLRAQEVNQFSGSSGASKGSLYTESEGVS